MGCKTRDVSSSSSSSSALKDALLFTTICMIGSPVEVQVHDGSIYSGIFHTACFHNDYGIVLKKAKIIKKGQRKTNFANDSVVDTLLVDSRDIVQVVAKGILLPAEGIVGNVPGEDVKGIARSAKSLEGLESELGSLISRRKSLKATKNSRQSSISNRNENKPVCGSANKSVRDRSRSKVVKGQSKRDYAAKSLQTAEEVEKGKLDRTHSTKIVEATTAPVGRVAEGQVGKDHQSQGKKYEPYQKFGSHKDNAIHEVQVSGFVANARLPQLQSLSSVQVDACKSLSDGPSYTSAVPLLVKPDTQDFDRPASKDSLNVPSPSHLSTSQSASQNLSIASKEPVSNTTSKEFKLNPGAKTFMPKFSVPKLESLPAATSMDFISNNTPMVPVAVEPPENGIIHFAARSSMPPKFVPYNSLVASNGDNATQYSQPIVGHAGNRLQSVRCVSQHNPLQAGPAYAHPSSQAVMVSRSGQLVYMHPMSHSSTIPAPASVRPQLTSQILLPKHQGSATTQALQVCVTQPPFVVGGQQPYAMASNILFSQPNFPAVRPIPIPGANGHFAKFL
ncbi:hypothetical protein AQUCO_01100036v1 [Aquilegia coerulea]|uniref:Ataxin 2 SM domain-containing protein n=1 Tax=Aquilegia coerulea TaxID=218851 RepID=A0A2G5E5D9_AQUCA|nr:hypothetical protein AQUCO_01100036v1 [Aquilegia coerulea]